MHSNLLRLMGLCMLVRLLLSVLYCLFICQKVNRSLRGAADGNFFNTFVTKEFAKRAPSPPKNPYADFKPSLVLDQEFISSCKELTIRNTEVVNNHIVFQRGFSINKKV